MPHLRSGLASLSVICRSLAMVADTTAVKGDALLKQGCEGSISVALPFKLTFITRQQILLLNSHV